MPKYNPLDKCGLCEREFGEVDIQFHHLIPKTHGGKEVVPIHKICHRKIHSLFTEKELQKKYFTFASLLEHEDVKIFVDWVKKKHPSFYVSSDNAKRKK
jgi:hypothetical protein